MVVVLEYWRSKEYKKKKLEIFSFGHILFFATGFGKGRLGFDLW
jgi:hypothetical protein